MIAGIDISEIPQGIQYVDFCPDYLVSGVDEQGYAVVPGGITEGGTMLCNFHSRKDCEYIADSNTMPVFGFKTVEKLCLQL